MDDSSFYQYENGLYYITSYKAKNDIYHMLFSTRKIKIFNNL